MLSSLQNLKYLIIRQSNPLTLSSDILFKLPKLHSIDFSYNDMRRWNGKDVFGHTTIRRMNLSFNHILAFKEEYFPLSLRSNLKKVDLANNPISCCCTNFWFREWIFKNPNIFKNYSDQYICELEGTLLKDYFPSENQCANINTLIVISAILCIIRICFILFASLLYKARWHIRHTIYFYRAKRKGYEQLERNQNFAYSGFVDYCEKDATWVLKSFIKMDDE